MPSNISAATATVITSLPYSIDVTPDSASQVLWWKYTATANDLMLSVFGWADDAAAYRPEVDFWLGDTADTIDDTTAVTSFTGERFPVQVPVTTGETYWFSVTDGNATEPLGGGLSFSVLSGSAARLRAGDLCIPDDSSSYPAAVLSPIDGEVMRFVWFLGVESGEALPTGEILTYNFTGGYNLYDHAFNLISVITGATSSYLAPPNVNTDHNETFYVFDPQTDNVFAISRDGTVLNTWALPGSGLGRIAPSLDGTILYFVESLATGISRWDLVNDVSLGALAGTAVPGYSMFREGMVFADGSFAYAYAGASDALIIRRAPDGTTLNTITFPPNVIDRLCIGLDYESLWVWTQDGFISSTFYHYRMDGTLIRSFTQPMSPRTLDFDGAPVEDPDRFGHAQSCPIFVLRRSETALITDESVPCCDTGCECELPSTPATGVPPTQGGSPSASPIPTVTGAVLPPVNLLAWTALCEGGGTVPTAADASDTESWVS